MAIAVTSTAAHTIVEANAAFRRLFSPRAEDVDGRPIIDVVGARDAVELLALLNHCYRDGVAVREHLLGAVLKGTSPLTVDVWPVTDEHGTVHQLVVEMRDATNAELTLALQREVAERLVLTTLRVEEERDQIEASRNRTDLLTEASRRLTASLDETKTLEAMSALSVPNLGAWCIVDLIEPGDAMRRLAIVHPDPAKQDLVRELEGRWIPHPRDPFGAPIVLQDQKTTVVVEGLDAVLAAAADSEILRILRALDFGSLLTVPLVVDEKVRGAVTFVRRRSAAAYSEQDVQLAEQLATQAAIALENARLFGEALSLRATAEAANQAKTAFLGRIAHEIRTPLNAIGGYVQLLEMGLRGEVSAELKADLNRIRANERHLLTLITELLNFARVGGGRVRYNLADVAAYDLIAATVDMVDPLFAQKGLTFEKVICDEGFVVHVDAEKVQQILINVMANAIKFTPAGGRVTVECTASTDSIAVSVTDTGIGIPKEKLEAVFEPFVQLKGGTAREGGIGLGLAISRDLARMMKCELTVESTPGKGSRFTLTMPRSRRAETESETKTAP